MLTNGQASMRIHAGSRIAFATPSALRKVSFTTPENRQKLEFQPGFLNQAIKAPRYKSACCRNIGQPPRFDASRLDEGTHDDQTEDRCPRSIADEQVCERQRRRLPVGRAFRRLSA